MLNSDTLARRQRREAFSYGGVFESLKWKRGRKKQVRKREKKEEEISALNQRPGSKPQRRLSLHSPSRLLTSFFLCYSSPLPLTPQPPPWWQDSSLNGHSIPIREHSGSLLGCRALNGGGNGYIRRLRRASIAADNGVVMVKETRLERVSENLDSH